MRLNPPPLRGTSSPSQQGQGRFTEHHPHTATPQARRDFAATPEIGDNQRPMRSCA